MDRDAFATRYDVGVPLDESTTDRNDRVMILYNDPGALPNDETVARQIGANGEIPLIDDVEKATENCDVLDLVLIQQKTQRQCTLIFSRWLLLLFARFCLKFFLT